MSEISSFITILNKERGGKSYNLITDCIFIN